MFGNNPRKQASFLFKCNLCETILDVKFEEDEEIDKTNDNKMELDCDCRSDII